MKKIDDRSALAEELLCELWEKKYFCELKLRTIAGETVTIEVVKKYESFNENQVKYIIQLN